MQERVDEERNRKIVNKHISYIDDLLDSGVTKLSTVGFMAAFCICSGVTDRLTAK